LRIPREQSGERRVRKVVSDKPNNIDDGKYEGKRALKIAISGFEELVEQEVILGYDIVVCPCDRGTDGRGVDIIGYLFNGLILGVQVKKDPRNSRKRDERIHKHLRDHPLIQLVIFVSLKKPTAYMDVFWEVVNFLKEAAKEPPIPQYFLEPKPKLHEARL